MATYAFSDIHGQYNLWKQIKDYCAEDDTLFFLGDALDRGDDGIKILQEMFNDKRVEYLLGNHEILFLDYINKSELDFVDKQIIKMNETEKTLEAFYQLPPNEQEKIKNKLNSLLFYKKYINKDNKIIYLSHAGFNIGKFMKMDKKQLEYKLIWDREHLQTKHWNPKYENEYVIHGHTPVQCLFKNDDEAVIYNYCDGHKFDIDLASFSSNKTVLLNLDTFEPIYFSIEK